MDEFIAKWLPIIISAVVAFFTAQVPLLVQRQKDKASEKLNEADTAGKYEQIARSAAEDVITKSNRIVELERQIYEMKGQIELLMGERRKLETERAAQNLEIIALREENFHIKARVKILEDILRENNIPVPVNGG